MCRTGVLSFRRVLPPLLSEGWGREAFSEAVGVEADTELRALDERVDSVVLLVLLVMSCDVDEDGGECVEWRVPLRVRARASVSAFPLTSWRGCLGGTVCLSEGGREGAGEGSFFPVTRDDTRLFLSGLDAVLLAGDSLFLLLLFMACRVCLSVVCRVCLSVPCLVSLFVRPWMAL